MLQLWGTDVELARRAPALARPVVGRARLVICASSALAGAARELGAREVRVIPSGVDIPPEEGEDEARAAARPLRRPALAREGHPRADRRRRRDAARRRRRRAAARAGARGARLRRRTPSSARTTGAAAVVAVPSRREGYGVVCAEAMAHGKPVVASAVGGLLDLVAHGETGLLVPPGDADGLREALRWLLGDAELRRRMGEAGARASARAPVVGAGHGRDARAPTRTPSRARVAGRARQDRLLGRRRRARVDARRLPARRGGRRAPAPAARSARATARRRSA